MKNSAIEQMYFGKRGQGQQTPLSDEYFRLEEIYNNLDKDFCEKLKQYPDLAKLYEKVSDALLDMQGELLHCEYQEGYRFGALMQMDILRGE